MMKALKDSKGSNRRKSTTHESSEVTYTEVLGKRSQNETSVDILESEESSIQNTNESQ